MNDINSPPPANDFNVLATAKIESSRKKAKAGIRWFKWIGALSIANSVFNYSQASYLFAAGLGITQVFDTLGEVVFSELANNTVAVILRMILFVLNLIIAGCIRQKRRK